MQFLLPVLSVIKPTLVDLQKNSDLPSFHFPIALKTIGSPTAVFTLDTTVEAKLRLPPLFKHAAILLLIV